MSDNSIRFGVRLRRLRRDRGWTQDQLAEAAAANPKYVGEIERGARNPSLDVIVRLAGALDVDVAELVGDDLTETDRDELLSEVQRRVELLGDGDLRGLVRLLRWHRPGSTAP